ncbi:uncharacterized protein LOC101853415 [Aplysia californica]|uniref:Uncharacterized protein LOC101853415 n=1 Tax=Aplysia californica TaxID=6500 RepID=A0ABM0K763_APLCA|nr:uncharacterized protein LOC101853415 [Aplysia californica]
MAMPPGGPMEVVFSFDTTGSMSQVLDEVKGRVNDIVQRLQADIPGFKVGIIAHGDYCDADHFYDIRILDLTDNVVDVVTFVTNTEGTGGGDIPECYELALRRAREMSWTPGSKRLVVVIGDAYPHGPDYEMNKDNIDWTDELKMLVAKDVKIYGVQVQEDPDSTSFFERLTGESGGQHLKLANMGTICQAIMGICYREQGAEMFQNYEAELRAKQGTKIGADLENVLGTLRHDDSVQSLIQGNGNPPDEELSDHVSDDDDDDDDDENDSGICDVASTSTVGNEPTTSTKRKLHFTSPKEPKKSNKVCPVGPIDVKQITKGGKRKGAKASNKKQMLVNKTSTERKDVLAKRGKRTVSARQKSSLRAKREWVSAQRFGYKNLSWSQWQQAVVPAVGDLTGQWRQIPQSGSSSYWRSDLLRLCKSKLDKLPGSSTLFEVGVQFHGRRGIQVVHLKSTKIIHNRPGGVFGLPWYSGMFRSIREQLNKTLGEEETFSGKQNPVRVFVRWAFVDDDVSAVKRNILKEYDYAWNCGRSV